MSSNLLKSVASVFVVLGAIALMAGGAMAQPKISGGVAAGFGQLSFDEGNAVSGAGVGVAEDGSTFNAQIEANLIVSGSNDSMDYYFRMRARGTDGNVAVNGTGTFSEDTPVDNELQTVRVRVGYNVSDAFRIEMGKLPGIGGIGFADKAPVRRPAGLRFTVNSAGFYDSTSINFSFKTGAMRVGLAISPDCEVSCAGNNVSTATTPNTLGFGNEQTMMPYFQGSFGPAKVGVRLLTASGDVVGDDGTGNIYDGSVDSDQTVFEVDYNFGAGNVALEYTTTTEGCLNANGASGCNDVEDTAFVIAVVFGGITFQYESGETDDGNAATTNDERTLMALMYMVDVPGGKIGGEYIKADYTDSGAVGATAFDEPSASLIRFVMTTGF